jgi:hypothetical protein
MSGEAVTEEKILTDHEVVKVMKDRWWGKIS